MDFPGESSTQRRSHQSSTDLPLAFADAQGQGDSETKLVFMGHALMARTCNGLLLDFAVSSATGIGLQVDAVPVMLDDARQRMASVPGRFQATRVSTRARA